MPQPPAKPTKPDGTIFGAFSGLLNDPKLDRHRALGIIAELADEYGVDVVAVLARATEKEIARANRKQIAEKKPVGRPSNAPARNEIAEVCTMLANQPPENQPDFRVFVAILSDDPRVPDETRAVCRGWLDKEERRDAAKKAGRPFFRSHKDKALDESIRRWFPLLAGKRNVEKTRA